MAGLLFTLTEMYRCMYENLGQMNEIPDTLYDEVVTLKDSIVALHSKFKDHYEIQVYEQDLVNTDGIVQGIAERVQNLAPQIQEGGKRRTRRARRARRYRR